MVKISKFRFQIKILFIVVLLFSIPFKSSHSKVVHEKDVLHLETFRKEPSQLEKSNSPYFEIVWDNYKNRKHRYGVLGAFFSSNEWRPFYYYTSAKTTLDDAIKLFYFMAPFKTYGGTILFLNDNETTLEEKNFYAKKYLHPNVFIQAKKNYTNYTNIYKNKQKDGQMNLLDKAGKQCADLGYKKRTEKFGECVLKLSE